MFSAYGALWQIQQRSFSSVVLGRLCGYVVERCQTLRSHPAVTNLRRAQSTRTVTFDPRTLSRKCSRKCPRECTRRCPRKCPRRLRLFRCKAHQRVPTKTPTRVLTGKFPVLTGDFPVLTKMYTKVSSVNFHMSYFHMFCFLAKTCPPSSQCFPSCLRKTSAPLGT